MKEVSIYEFKANCPSLLEEVCKTRTPICVTRLGKPVAEVVPPTSQTARSHKKRRLGSMAGTAEIVGDIVGPISS